MSAGRRILRVVALSMALIGLLVWLSDHYGLRLIPPIRTAGSVHPRDCASELGYYRRLMCYNNP